MGEGWRGVFGRSGSAGDIHELLSVSWTMAWGRTPYVVPYQVSWQPRPTAEFRGALGRTGLGVGMTHCEGG